MPTSSQASSSTRAAVAPGSALGRPVPIHKGSNSKDRVVPSASSISTTATPVASSSTSSKGFATNPTGPGSFVEMPGMSSDPLTPREISSAVEQLLDELIDRQRSVVNDRENQLVDLYLMVRTLIRGQGFATMEDVLDGNTSGTIEDGEDEADQRTKVKQRLELQDREGLGMFLQEYLMKEGSVRISSLFSIRLYWQIAHTGLDIARNQRIFDYRTCRIMTSSRSILLLLPYPSLHSCPSPVLKPSIRLRSSNNPWTSIPNPRPTERLHPLPLFLCPRRRRYLVRPR